jgi:hypothetical protein
VTRKPLQKSNDRVTRTGYWHTDRACSSTCGRYGRICLKHSSNYWCRIQSRCIEAPLSDPLRSPHPAGRGAGEVHEHEGELRPGAREGPQARKNVTLRKRLAGLFLKRSALRRKLSKSDQLLLRLRASQEKSPRSLQLILTDQPTRRIRLQPELLNFSQPTCFRNGHPSQTAWTRRRCRLIPIEALRSSSEERARSTPEAYGHRVPRAAAGAERQTGLQRPQTAASPR